MPSGKVHDKITVLTAAAAVPAWWVLTPERDLSAFACGLCAYLFSGFWLSDDLDTRSVCYKRWGFFRFLWYPYRKIVPHRSWLSHGPFVGPLLRIAYFAFMFWLTMRGVLWAINRYIAVINRDSILHHIGIDVSTFFLSHPTWTWYALAGLILGGIAHTIADGIVSFAKYVW